jgi:hypothetical protein
MDNNIIGGKIHFVDDGEDQYIDSILDTLEKNPPQKIGDGLSGRVKEHVQKVILKHLQGKHNQKRHGYRAYDTNSYYASLQRIRKTGKQKDVDYFLGRNASRGNLPIAAARNNDFDDKGLSKREVEIIRRNYQKFWIDKAPANSVEVRKTLLNDFMDTVSLFSKKEHVREVVYKHLQGKHNQKRHGRKENVTQKHFRGWHNQQTHGNAGGEKNSLSLIVSKKTIANMLTKFGEPSQKTLGEMSRIANSPKIPLQKRSKIKKFVEDIKYMWNHPHEDGWGNPDTYKPGKWDAFVDKYLSPKDFDD